jgi:hypothetical protein
MQGNCGHLDTFLYTPILSDTNIALKRDYLDESKH